jgi:S-layer homology domain
MKLTVRMFALAISLAAILFLGLGVTAARALVPLPDYNEPNNTFATATALVDGKTAWGAITPTPVGDVDYFYLDLAGSRQVTVDFTTGGPRRECRLAFQPAGSDAIADLGWDKAYDDDASFHASGTAGSGRLFAVVSKGSSDPSTMIYTITITATGGASGSFPDVTPGSPYYSAITYLAQKGVISGYGNGNFGPNDPVTRQQFAKMIVRAVGYAVSSANECPFVDVDRSVPGHYLDSNDALYPDHYIAVAALHGITVGETASTFGPYHNIKMAQVTTMVVRTAENEGLWDSPPSGYVPPFEDFGPPHYGPARVGAAHGLFTGYTGPWTWSAPASRGQCVFFIWKLILALELDGGEPQPVY